MTKYTHCHGARFSFEVSNLSFEITSTGTDITLAGSVPPRPSREA